ncbi:hypothetical protein BKE30_02065 [Alkanindiges hydrocarboniclasticus]|uniref:Sulfatase-modifying factor enzyme-like domain-containing protein n=1 Tax=Alkanindiges hydrocarboniclasticus TaxID=1907941 RepID=A0A1S8CYG3_9GAMM|nr:SUMF1/EgtB/PvdO family nonheme iron enzyme [Alkanindiges hydrocarboniclasticus]ONG41894.1 hypothetical protein BKE30_02065 [Alkanindiges hydrocarboniclasticus]
MKKQSLYQCYRLMALGLFILPVQGCHQPVSSRDQSQSALSTKSLPLKLGALQNCMHYSGLPENFGKDPKAGMAYIASGELQIGSTQGYQDELPLKSGKASHIAAFWIDQTEVTNAQFSRFVKATGYMTDAEKTGGGAVFVPPGAGAAISNNSWWHFVKGANWKQPHGPGSSIQNKDHEPVVLVTKNDAEHYAVWLGHDLPTEAQWEYAAKAQLPLQGQEQQAKAHKVNLLDKAPHDKHGIPSANYWQGDFPLQNTQADHFAGIAPVGCYAANPYGLYDMIGNVWEWTQSPYYNSHEQDADAHNLPDGHGGNPALARNSTTQATAFDRGFEARSFVIKGGSYLCAANYCVRYRAAARHPQETNLPTSHVGFRTVLNLK